MKILKEEFFRSTSDVSKNNNMVRATIVLTKHEWLRLKRIYKMEFKKLSDVVDTENIKETIDWLSGMCVVNKEFMDMTMQVIEKQSKKIKEQEEIIKQLCDKIDKYDYICGPIDIDAEEFDNEM